MQYQLSALETALSEKACHTDLATLFYLLRPHCQWTYDHSWNDTFDLALHSRFNLLG